MLLRNVIGAALRRIRQDEGRTLREVASIANISMPYLSEIERGRKEPSSEILAGICAALGLTMLDLLHEATVEGQSAEGQSVAALVVDLTAPVAPVTAITPAHERVDAHAGAHAHAHAQPRRGDEIALAVAA